MIIKKTYIIFLYTICSILSEELFNKLNIEIYYDSFTKNSLNILGSNLKEFLNIENSIENVNIDLNPFAEGSFYKFQKTSLFSCPLGENQCNGNIIQGCIITKIPEKSLYLKFISCLNFLKNKFENLGSKKLFVNCKNALKIKNDELDRCVNDKKIGSDNLLPFAVKASELKGEIYPLVKINGVNLNLNQTHYFSQNITQFICNDYEQEFCKESEMVEKVSQEDKDNLKEKINSLISEFENLKEATDKKFETMTQSLKGVLNGYENNVFTFDEISKNLDNFQQMFNNTITEKSKLTSIFHSQLDLQRTTNLAQIDNTKKNNHKKDTKKMLDQNKMILNAIVKRLDILKDDFAYQIMSINENIKMARNHQKQIFNKNRKEKKIIKDNTININSLDEMKKTPMIVKIKFGSNNILKNNSNSNSHSNEINIEDIDKFEQKDENISEESDEFHIKLKPITNEQISLNNQEEISDQNTDNISNNSNIDNLDEDIINEKNLNGNNDNADSTNIEDSNIVNGDNNVNQNRGIVNNVNEVVKEDINKMVGVIKGFFNDNPVKVNNLDVNQDIRSVGVNEDSTLNENIDLNEKNSSNEMRNVNDSDNNNYNYNKNQIDINENEEDKLNMNLIKDVRENMEINNQNSNTKKNGISIQNNKIKDKNEDHNTQNINKIENKKKLPIKLPRSQNQSISKKETENNKERTTNNERPTNNENINNQKLSNYESKSYNENISNNQRNSNDEDERLITSDNERNSNTVNISDNQRNSNDQEISKNERLRISDNERNTNNLPEIKTIEEENTNSSKKSEADKAMELALAEFN